MKSSQVERNCLANDTCSIEGNSYYSLSVYTVLYDDESEEKRTKKIRMKYWTDYSSYLFWCVSSGEQRTGQFEQCYLSPYFFMVSVYFYFASLLVSKWSIVTENKFLLTDTQTHTTHTELQVLRK